MTDRRPVALPHVVFRRLAGTEWALYDPHTHRVHTLNLSAAVVWEHCDGHSTVDEVVRAVEETFGAVPPSTRREAADMVDWFVAEGLMAWT